MYTDKTPLQKLQDEAALFTGLDGPDDRTALDAFLVQAFDLGVRAANELAEEATESETRQRERRCTCPAKAAGFSQSLGLHTFACPSDDAR